jgi:SulP family sulfate permease
MVVAVTVGIVFASLLFMERMAAVSRVSLISSEELDLDRPLPPNLVLYEIAGPLFFGAAQKAMTAVRAAALGVRVVVFDLRAVPLLDATGLVALESTVAKLRAAGVFVVLAGVQREPLRVLARAGWRNREGELVLGRSFEEALDIGLAIARGGTVAPASAVSPGSATDEGSRAGA